MGLIKEFRDFAMRGNVIDMAVGVIIGTAFGKVVDSLVKQVMMPPIDYITQSGKAAAADPLAAKFDIKKFWEAVGYDKFFGEVGNFLIIAFCLFLIIKAVNVAKKRFEEKKLEKPAEAPADIKLLTEIRDLLAKQQGKTAV